jgi:SAM-dependent methyltransferase
MSPENECAFYQTIDIPGIGECHGAWDHRNTVDAYLGHVDFRGKSVLDVGPANGFFTFAMEQRGAEVTAIDLGEAADWDAVPNAQAPWKPEELKARLRRSVRRVENAFWLAHKALGSKARLIYGAVYDVPKVLNGKVDVALMSNVLLHLRDPLLALQRVAEVVRNTMVITEATRTVEEAFLNGTDMRFLPRLETPGKFGAWWWVPPRLTAEVLKLLGFGDVKWEYHDEWFNGDHCDPNPRMVRHYTVTGTRLDYDVRFGEGWYNGETNGSESWHWSRRSHARVTVEMKNKKEGVCGSLILRVAALAPCHLSIKLNGRLISEFDCFGPTVTQQVVDAVQFEPASNLIEILSDKPVSQGSPQDPRHLGFALYHLGCDWRRP